MANRQPRRTEAARQGIRLLHTIGDELREARLIAGLTQTDVARALCTTRRRLGRIESGRVPLVPLADLAVHAGIVGLRLHARLYPAGPPLRDKAQLALLDRFQRRLSPAWHVCLEEPLTGPGDQRAWDMVLRWGDVAVGIEAISRLRDAPIKQVVVTDTIPLTPDKQLPKIKVLSVAPLLAYAIKRIHFNESVSRLFE